jgi:hypothetical protein
VGDASTFWKPLRVASDEDWDQEPLTRGENLARQGPLLKELLSRLEHGPALVLPLGRNSESAERYCYLSPKSPNDQGLLVQAPGKQDKVLIVRTPDAFPTVLARHANQLAFRTAGSGGEVVLLASVKAAALEAWRKEPGDSRRPLPLWLMTTETSLEKSGAPFLAARPDGKTPLGKKALEDARVSDLDWWAANPGRVQFIRELTRKGGVRLLSVREEGTVWTLLAAKEQPRPGRVQPGQRPQAVVPLQQLRESSGGGPAVSRQGPRAAPQAPGSGLRPLRGAALPAGIVRGRASPCRHLVHEIHRGVGGGPDQAV